MRPCAAGALSYSGQLLHPGDGMTASAADPSAGDGMDNLTAQAARLRFGRDLRLLEVRNLLRSSAPVVLRMGTTPEVRAFLLLVPSLLGPRACSMARVTMLGQIPQKSSSMP